MNIDMIHAAYDRIKGSVRKTPMLSSPFLDEIAGRRVLVKAECLQHTGSFKYRGASAAVSALTDKNGVLAYSSGNHAQGVALAAAERGLKAVIVMPKDAPQLKIENTRALGAEVVLYDRETESREEIGQTLAAERGLTLIRPYDEPQVIAGQGTCGLEIAEQTKKLGVSEAEVLVCCGGGGLTSGIAMALEAQAPNMRVRPCEPEGFDDVTRSLVSGAIQSNNKPMGSLCDSIVTMSPGEITFPIMKRLCGAGIDVSDDEALRAMAQAFKRLKLVAEPGGAVALAAALFKGSELTADTVIVTISGGNVDADIFTRALAMKA